MSPGACCSDSVCGSRATGRPAADALPARARRRTFCNSYVIVWVAPQLSQPACTRCKCTLRWRCCFGAVQMHRWLGKGMLGGRSLTLKCILADVTHGCQLCQQLQKPCAAQQHRHCSMGVWQCGGWRGGGRTPHLWRSRCFPGCAPPNPLLVNRI